MVSTTEVKWLAKAFVVSVLLAGYYLCTVPLVAQAQVAFIETWQIVGSWMLLGCLAALATVFLGIATFVSSLDRVTSWIFGE